MEPWSSRVKETFNLFVAIMPANYFTNRHSSNKLVDQILQKFLAAAFVGGRFAFFEHVFLQGLKIALAGFDLLAEAAVPRTVAMPDKLRQAPVLADGGRDSESAREGVHAADVRVKQIDRLETFAPHFGVEIHAAGGQAARVENGEHALRRQVDVRRELVGVPAQQHVACVGVDGAERAGGGGHFQFMLHGVAGEGGVVGFQVQFEMVQQIVFAQEVQAGGRVGIVLMFGWLLGLWLDVELALEADFLFVIDGHVEEGGQMVQFAFEVGVEQRGIALAPAPKDIAGPAQLMRHLQRLFDLRGGVGEDIGVATGGRAVGKAGMDEQTGRSPQQPDAGALLLFLEHLDDGVEVFVRLRQRGAFGGHVAVVEGVKRRAQLFKELEGHARAAAGVVERIALVIPGALHGGRAEHVGPAPAKGVPIHDREPKMLAHGPAGDDFLGVIMFEGERIPGLGAFVRNARDIGKC
jgi:hypothetical protein